MQPVDSTTCALRVVFFLFQYAPVFGREYAIRLSGRMRRKSTVAVWLSLKNLAKQGKSKDSGL